MHADVSAGAVDSLDPVTERPAIIVLGFMETNDVQLIPSFQEMAHVVELPTAPKLLSNRKLPQFRQLVAHMKVSLTLVTCLACCSVYLVLANCDSYFQITSGGQLHGHVQLQGQLALVPV